MKAQDQEKQPAATAKGGNVEIPIWKREVTKKLKDGTLKPYTDYYFYYYDQDAKRKMVTKADLEKAKKEAKSIAASLSRGEGDIVSLSSEDKALLQRVRQFQERSNIDPLLALAEYEALRKMVPNVPVTEIGNFYAKRVVSNITRKTVREVVDEFIASKEADGKSDVYVADLRWRLDLFAGKFKTTLDDITADEIKDFISDMKKKDGKRISGRSQKNHFTALNTFFEFAKAKRYLAKDHDEMEQVGKIGTVKVVKGKLMVFTPEEMTKLFANAPDKFIPYLAIGAFAGVRNEEILRIHWEQVNFATNTILIPDEQAKTGSGRPVPMSENLAAWLKPHVKKTGEVWPLGKAYANELKDGVAAKAGVKWKINGLRKSFISYRVALTKNVPQTALEAGNSVEKIYSNYLNFKSEDEAKQWFSITPESVAAFKELKGVNLAGETAVQLAEAA